MEEVGKGKKKEIGKTVHRRDRKKKGRKRETNTIKYIQDNW